MARESTQHKLDRVRPPRVQITYDVQIGDAIELKELPFMMGVVGDFSGMPVDPPPKLKDRKFVNIDRDNFNEVLKGIKPHLAYRVDNTLSKDGTQLGVDLSFNDIHDFEPANVVKQIKPLRELLEKRQKLSDLVNKMYGNDKLEELLRDVLANTEHLQKLSAETNYQSGKEAGTNDEQTSEDKETGASAMKPPGKPRRKPQPSPKRARSRQKLGC
jgi:type VI secretion system protein ImpB